MKKVTSKPCPCGSHQDYVSCCGLYLNIPMQNPPSPETLMRSRYTAYTLANTQYIKKTMRGKALQGFNRIEAQEWAKSVNWIGLQVVKTSAVVLNRGYVEFIASFIEGGELKTLHEVSEFVCKKGVWFYVDGVPGAG